ncbi:unnamed protein product, partial [Ranitomeya imitator]
MSPPWRTSPLLLVLLLSDPLIPGLGSLITVDPTGSHRAEGAELGPHRGIQDPVIQPSGRPSALGGGSARTATTDGSTDGKNVASVSTPVSAPQPSPRLARPPRYGGDPKACRSFLNQCQLHFALSPLLYPTDRAKVAFIVSHLEGEALAWVNPLWQRDDPLVSQLNLFLDTFCKVFDEPGRLVSTTESLFNLYQGNLSVAQYAIRFWTLSSDLGWNNEALVERFGVVCLHRLRMSWLDTPTSLDDLISLAIRIDLCFQERTRELVREKRPLRQTTVARGTSFSQAAPVASSSSPEPMQVDRLKSSEQRRKERLAQVPLISYVPVLRSRETPPPRTGSRHFSMEAYVDSGAAGNFVQLEVVNRLGIPVRPLETPRQIASVDGQPLRETVNLVTEEVELQIGALHREKLAFYVLPSLSHSFLLGLPWLRDHEPTLDWRTGDVLPWGQSCLNRCLLPVKPASSSRSASESVGIPPAYCAFTDVFNKKEAEILLPHRAYDCPIDLVPGSTPPRGRIYPLSPTETQAMSEYIQENLARGFIRKSSSPAGAGFFFVKKKDAPISSMIRKGANPHQWSSEAEEALRSIKEAFASAPILHHPVANKPFILEVDASAIGAGAVLSQKSSSGRLVPCGFISKIFSSEKNYSIGDKELLAIRLALEEWWYLLEGALHRFIIYTDQKNLAYIRSAPRLNLRQARWALFFARFDFELRFLPGNKNSKADALSRSFQVVDLEDEPAYIIDPARVITVAPVSLTSLPPGKTFVAEGNRRRVLLWGHASKLAGRVGFKKTFRLISHFYWWPTLSKDVQSFVVSCPSCAKNKIPRQLPSGLLHPLPVPSTPWQHLSMDFITDLPHSSGCTVIFVAMDRFSKMARFIALPGLPSAPELAKIFVHHIFRLHGLPLHIVSDRGVQFTAHFWRSLCKSMNISLDFSSAYHPQSNGQVERTNQTLVSDVHSTSRPGQSAHSPPRQSAHSPPGQSTHSPPGQSTHSPPGQSTHSPPGQSAHSPLGVLQNFKDSTKMVSDDDNILPLCLLKQLLLTIKHEALHVDQVGMEEDMTQSDYVDECAALTPPCGLDANCTNTIGSFICRCHRGFLQGPFGCEDVDECQVAEITGLQACPPHSTCLNTIGSFSCSCDKGFVFGLDGKHCVDVDECAFEDGCRRELGNLCLNADGSYRCSCQAGFQESGLSCSDVDECKDNPNICSGIGVCENMVGSYRCGCRAGFRGNGTYCEDENECVSGRHGCDTNAHCGNVVGSYFCQCYHGFKGDGYSCFDIDECSVDNGFCEQLCVNQAGSFQCQCHQGYRLLNNGKNCTDFDECQTQNGKCQQMCRNTNGSYQCLCRKGFQLHVDQRQCVDIDECKIDNGGCTHSCNNTEGGFLCKCPAHQTLAKNQQTCINITSCGMNNGGCQQRCSDRLEGGFECSCQTGYRLGSDGRTCDDVDECVDFTHGGCQQSCRNTLGSYNCSCYTGFTIRTDDPTKCQQLWCVCVATDTCDCPAGYPGPGCSAMCSPPCAHGGTCMRHNTCACPPGWTGSGCQTAVCNLPCANGGRCVAPETCQCLSGYSGEQCLTQPFRCEKPCVNGGRCSGYNVCRCPVGFLGAQCEAGMQSCNHQLQPPITFPCSSAASLLLPL